MTSSDRARGAAWGIWDLHVHTPASLVHGYGGDSDDVWEQFLAELEALPPDVKVVGINDYWFLDGYKRVLAARRTGRVANLDAIFPVVEMRLAQFGGTAGNLSRVNLHVIFDPDLDPSVIETQFLNALHTSVKLTPGRDEGLWSGVITRDSLGSLGAAIIDSVPADQQKKYSAPHIEGFNNLNVELADVQRLLDGTFFRGKALIGIGKTEWADVKWTDQSIAAKKNVINSADLVFTAYEDPSRWSSDVEKLTESMVNSRVLDCSDAHHFAGSAESMRIGNCQTWINTVPTLAGLAYALEEFGRRVYVGLEPPVLGRVRRNPERFLERIKVGSARSGRDLFDMDLPLNSGFVAIVGNKGQGKSALLDCLALAGNSSRQADFAFLTSTRFLSSASRKIARDFESEVHWATGATRKVPLDASHDAGLPVAVEYLPQAYVERVCNTDPASGEDEDFERELRAVLFTHIPEEQRAGKESFDDLLALKLQSALHLVEERRVALGEGVHRYVATAAFRAAHSITDVQRRLDAKKAEVEAARVTLRSDEASLAELDGDSEDDGRLAALKLETVEIARERLTLDERRAALVNDLGSAERGTDDLEALDNLVSRLLKDAATVNSAADVLLGERASKYVSVLVATDDREAWKSANASREAELARSIKETTERLAELDKRETANSEALSAVDSARERARQRVLQSESRVADLTGNVGDPESLVGLEGLLERVKSAPSELSREKVDLLRASGEVHGALASQLAAVAGLYAPASDFIADAEVLADSGLEFVAELRAVPWWRDVSASLDGRKNGDFGDWLAALPQRAASTAWDELEPELNEALERLERERGDVRGAPRHAADALRTSASLEAFLMELLDLQWLELRFGIEGDGMALAQLSPGQRGLVLALFYLVVDRRNTPLLLDQPEENLDNETISGRLVPALHEAAGRRQTIVVTHNANLAVVGDADQVVHCEKVDGRFLVSSGSIAELEVTRHALNVLEGTKLAFDNRRHKYENFPELR